MHIVNIMFSAGGGGIEQAFVDYCEGLRDRGHEITAIISPGAVVTPQLEALGIRLVTMRNLGQWDIFAATRLGKCLDALAPDIVIAHANRAFSLARKALKGRFPLIGMAQNYNIDRLKKGADGLFATTQDLIGSLERLGVVSGDIFHIPNMIRCTELPQREPRHEPPVIGTLGRFVKKKGFDIYIDALALLKQRGYRFKAILGGTGVENDDLRARAKVAGLDDCLTFPGWVGDKKAFYTSIDIFCLPSLHEPFGIVLLEAFCYGVPVVATDSEGPRDFMAHEGDSLIVPIGNAEAMASAMAQLLDNPLLADKLAANGFAKARTQYSIDVVAERIEKALHAVIVRRTQAIVAKAA